MMRPDPSRLAAMVAEALDDRSMPAHAVDLLLAALRKRGAVPAAEPVAEAPPRRLTTYANAAARLGLPVAAVRGRVRRGAIQLHQGFVDLDEVRAEFQRRPLRKPNGQVRPIVPPAGRESETPAAG